MDRLHRLINKLFNNILLLVKSRLSQIDDKAIFFFPHINCANDNYDIINYKSDNVLCLFNSILRDPEFEEYKLYIIYFDESKVDDYKCYCENYNISRILFLNYYDTTAFYSNFYKCKYVFTDEIYHNHRFKKKKQTIICLNYYPFPYKSDYIKLFDEKSGRYKYLKEQKRINKYYDYLVSVSDLASVAIMQAEPFYYEKCITLGFPRSDVFYSDNNSLKAKVISLFSFEVKKIFIYVPTHRDYENKCRKLYDKNVKERTIWGYESIEKIQCLERFLQEENAIIIAKIHPAQDRDVLSDLSLRRIVTYYDIESKLTVSLNELLAISDAMITDYTSAVFDYLMLNKPIIYYHYDIDKYDKTRGFFLNPMAPLCAGEVCFNLQELVDSLNKITNGIDEFKNKRKFLLDLLFTYQDSLSTERVKYFFFQE